MNVNEYNAERYSDRYAVTSHDGATFFGCEHNETEARMIAAWIKGNKGTACKVVRNSIDEVRAAQGIRGTRTACAFPARDMALDEMQQLADAGLWK